MPSGAYVKGELGQIQIDENFRNIALVARGYVNLPAAFGETKISVPASSVMVAFRCGKWIYVHETQLSSNSITYTLRNGENGAGAPVEFYAFSAASGGGNSGMEVFNASGAQVFHSDLAYWNYHGIYSAMSGTGIDVSFSFPPLVVQLGQSTFISMYSEVDAYISTTYFRTVGNRVETLYSNGIVGGSYPGNFTYGQDGATLLVLNSTRIY
jgi:hypothetical protein